MSGINTVFRPCVGTAARHRRQVGVNIIVRIADDIIRTAILNLKINNIGVRTVDNVMPVTCIALK